MNAAKISDLVGQTIVAIDGMEAGSGSVTLTMSDGRKYEMDHSQDCCESVSLYDVCGDGMDLIGSPIVRAEEPSSSEEPTLEGYHDVVEWTFYILGTAKGTVTLRWLGESNGYYSTAVDFWEVKPC